MHETGETSSPVVAAVGDRGSQAAVEVAATEALRRGSTLHLVHAWDVERAARAGAAEVDRREQEAADRLADAVRRASALVSGLVPVTATLSPAAAVPAVALAAQQAALVAVGRRADSHLTHPYERSVTGGVAARASAPVISVPDAWVEGSRARAVVVGVEEPEHSRGLVTSALGAARARRARLVVLCTWWRPVGSGYTAHPTVVDAGWPERLEEGVDRVLSRARLEYDDVPVEIHVRNARPGDALIEASDDASLVVLGRHATLVRGGSHLGPVARAVLREAACPVLLTVPTTHHLVEPTTSARHVQPV